MALDLPDETVEEDLEDEEAREMDNITNSLLLKQNWEANLDNLQLTSEQIAQLRPGSSDTDAQESNTQDEHEEEDEEVTNTEKSVSLADLIPPIPARGTYDVNKVTKSLYFFS